MGASRRPLGRPDGQANRRLLPIGTLLPTELMKGVKTDADLERGGLEGFPDFQLRICKAWRSSVLLGNGFSLLVQCVMDRIYPTRDRDEEMQDGGSKMGE